MSKPQYVTPEELVKITEHPYIAMDQNGCWHQYVNEPHVKDLTWLALHGCRLLYINIKYDGEWNHSLRSRIQTSTYRPLETEAELAGLVGRVLRAKHSTEGVYLYALVSNVKCSGGSIHIEMMDTNFPPDEVLDSYTYKDGSPVGILIQE